MSGACYAEMAARPIYGCLAVQDVEIVAVWIMNAAGNERYARIAASALVYGTAASERCAKSERGYAHVRASSTLAYARSRLPLS